MYATLFKVEIIVHTCGSFTCARGKCAIFIANEQNIDFRSCCSIFLINCMILYSLTCF